MDSATGLLCCYYFSKRIYAVFDDIHREMIVRIGEFKHDIDVCMNLMWAKLNVLNPSQLID